MRTTLITSAMLVAAAAALGCADSTAPAAGRPISVSFTTGTSSGATLSRSLDPARNAATAPAPATLTITSAQLVLSRIELQGSGAGCNTDSAAGDDEHQGQEDCAELELAPTVVDLPVSGTVVNTLDITVPEGSYSSLSARIRPIRAGNDHGRGSSAFLTAHPEFDGVSVLVKGTYNNAPFTYKGAVSTGIEQSFSPPLAVAANGLNLTVKVDLASWFLDQSSTPIDPNTANGTGANADLVAGNIRRSFRAFRDDDHDGREDGPHTP